MPVWIEEDTNPAFTIEETDSSEGDSLEEDMVDILARHGDLDQEEVVRKYGCLKRAQRGVVDHPAASVRSIVKAFTFREPSIGTSRNEDSIWDIIDRRRYANALKYKGLSEPTRDALLAAPVTCLMEPAQMDAYAKDCHDHLTALTLGSSIISDEDRLSIKQRFNLDFDDKNAENTLKIQFRRYVAAVEDEAVKDEKVKDEKVNIEISEMGQELYTLDVFSRITREIFDLSAKFGISLPGEPPSWTLVRLPVKTKLHAKESWKMISEAYSSDLTAPLRGETLAFEQENRMRLLADWPTWGEKGSRAEWMEKQIKEGNWEQIAPWLQRTKGFQ
ncbi:hypothetical protein I302_106575 [Kwoniella bestiolae CBS 10118]|uniref:Uncharacterized protein n=1 Tax=Kwoniella bestiolae CBS 10118 TaxID=1296100 RepID=A0A1B9G103_9TREE|nr:hypothetical protein I302_06163 [Kwoniella bestiolae CBS 10118]OCF24702.1 hypothetical protein I302_06163 [Kwoniella bestiolae CBS 10118]